jgi:peroxiredoxin
VQVHGVRDQIEAKGAQLVFVGNGAPHMAKAFQEDYGITSQLFTDPSLAAYRALGLRKTGKILKALAAAPRAMMAGFFQGKTQGDAMQIGGVFVVDKRGDVVFAHKSDAAGDHPSTDAILAALERLPPTPAPAP